MHNIINYVWDYGKETLFERPFCVEDALVLSEFCYLKYDGLVPGMEEKPIFLSELDKDPDKENLFWDKRYERDNRALYNAILFSKRFKNLRLGFYNNIIDAEHESQFSAITYFLDAGVTVITFRGTDETIAGWQEDFGMMLKKPIMGQTLSVEYLKKLAAILPGSFYVTGHSKGGNLSMYSAMCSDRTIQDRIIKVLSFDGPGFRPEFISEKLTENIREKSHTYIPRSSPIGLMLSTPGDMTIIEAKAVGAMQHNPYNWLLKDGKLVESKISEQHKLMMESTNQWIFNLDDTEIQQFVSLMCWLLSATNADTTIEFQDNFSDHAKALYKATREASNEVKDMASEFMRSYVSLAGDNFKDEFKNKYDEFIEGLKQASEEAQTNFIEKKDEMKKGVTEMKDEFMKGAQKMYDELITFTVEATEEIFKKKKKDE